MKPKTGPGTWLILATAVACLGFAPAASASKRGIAWWDSGGISMVNLEDGSGGGTLRVGPIGPSGPSGLAYDAAERRFYWTDLQGLGCDGRIAFASSQGQGGGLLETGEASVCDPYGPAIDPEARRIYWANAGNATISWANLDGSGGGDLDTTGATVVNPVGVAIDPDSARIYWASRGIEFEGEAISYANLDGSGGGDLNTNDARVEPDGLAIDPIGQRIYWPNSTFGPDSISYANLDGSGGDDLNTGWATVEAGGIVIDPAKRRLYWGESQTPQISFARLDRSGGGGIDAGRAPIARPRYPTLFDSPPNRFKVGNPRQNLACRVLFTVPGAGELEVTGARVSKSRRWVDRPESKAVWVRPTQRTARKLADRGRLDAEIDATYTPLGGTPRTKKSLTLRLKPNPGNAPLAKCELRL